MQICAIENNCECFLRKNLENFLSVCILQNIVNTSVADVLTTIPFVENLILDEATFETK